MRHRQTHCALALLAVTACTDGKSLMVEPPPIDRYSAELGPREPPPPPRPPNQQRFASAAQLVLGLVVLDEARAGRRVVYSPLSHRELPWVGAASVLLCAGTRCDTDCIAELNIEASACGTNRGITRDSITVVATRCGAPRMYDLMVAYDPLRIVDEPAIEEAPTMAPTRILPHR